MVHTIIFKLNVCGLKNRHWWFNWIGVGNINSKCKIKCLKLRRIEIFWKSQLHFGLSIENSTHFWTFDETESDMISWTLSELWINYFRFTINGRILLFLSKHKNSGVTTEKIKFFPCFRSSNMRKLMGFILTWTEPWNERFGIFKCTFGISGIIFSALFIIFPSTDSFCKSKL